MNFNDRFINLLEDPRLSSATPFDLAARILGALWLFRSGPCTFYLGGPCVLDGAHERFPETIPARVSWEFGPGAVVVMTPRTIWNIEGPTDLGLERRFVCPTGASVQLSGPLDVIRPEWWGVDAPDEALRHAVELVKHRARSGAPQVPVALRGPYRLRTTLSIDAHDPDAGMAIEFVGRHPVGDVALSPTLRWARPDDLPGGSGGAPAYPRIPLVEIGDGVRATFSHVGFDTSRGSVELASARGGISHKGFARGVFFRRCSFFFDHGDLLALALADHDSRGDIVERSSGRATFEECWFEGKARSTPGTAIRVSESGSPRLRLDGCTFQGNANAMVAVPSGLVEIVGCQFSLSSDFDPSRDEVVTDIGGDRERGFPPARFHPGVDVVVGRPARSRGEHIIQSVQAGIERSSGLSTNPGPIGLSVLHAQSRSPRFLHGDRHFAAGDGFVSMTGLVSQQPLTPVVPLPAISWRGATDAGVLLQGSDVAGSIDCGDQPVFAPSSRIRGGVRPTRPSLDLASRE